MTQKDNRKSIHQDEAVGELSARVCSASDSTVNESNVVSAQQSAENTAKLHNVSHLWIFSASTDFAIFFGPILFSLVLLPVLLNLPVNQVPLWLYLLLVVSLDVAHVWATLFRTIFDPAELARRPKHYVIGGPLVFVLSLALCLISQPLFWSCAAYLAIYHFIKQDYGFLALYKVRAGERNRLDYLADKFFLYLVTCLPVLFWHATPNRRFDWFDAGEQFVFGGLPETVRFWFVGLYALAVLSYVGIQVFQVARGNPRHWPKIAFLTLVALRWGVGSLFEHPLVSLAFINLFHGLPYIVLTRKVTLRRWKRDQPRTNRERLAIWLLSYGGLGFLALIGSLGLIEECLWDVFVWQRYAKSLFEVSINVDVGLKAFFTALLAWPQLFHYLADSWLWRFDGSNPGLKEDLLTI